MEKEVSKIEQGYYLVPFNSFFYLCYQHGTINRYEQQSLEIG